MNINWYPGHMAKTKKTISENLKLVDAVIEILDARIPLSSKNPDIDLLCKGKPKIVILNKCDMADSEATERWLSYFRRLGHEAIAANCETGEGIRKIPDILKRILKEKLERNRQKGVFKPIRIMVVGIPNSGKSSFINRMAKKQTLKTENRPGVTVRQQWVKISEEIELLDTPGILWPKLDGEKTALNLAYTGAIKGQILDSSEICVRFLEFMLSAYPEALAERYGITIDENEDRLSIYDKIAYKRGYIFSKEDPDYTRCANAVLDDFRNLKFGKITLEMPEEKD